MSITVTTSATLSQFQHEGFPSMNFKQGHAFPITQTLTYGATINWNANLGQCAIVTLSTGSASMANPTNLVVGAFYSLEIIQPSATVGTVTWGTLYRFSNNSAPTLTSAGSLRDVIVFKYDGVTLYEHGRSMSLPTT